MSTKEAGKIGEALFSAANSNTFKKCFCLKENSVIVFREQSCFSQFKH